MSWLDFLPSSERRKIRKRMRSPEAYEKTRKGVKGPEELDKEMKHNENLAELKFAIESSPEKYKEFKEKIDLLILNNGIENIVEISNLSDEARKSIEDGNYEIQIETDNSNYPEQIVLIAEGNVSEKVPMISSRSENYL